MMYQINVKNDISLVVFVYCLARFIDLFFSSSKLMLICFTIVEAIPLIWFVAYGCKLNKNSFLILVLGLFSVCTAMLHSDIMYISDIVYTVLGLFMGYHLSVTKMKRNHAKFLYYTFFVLILLRFILVRNPNDVFVSSSRNAISAILILGSALLYSTYEEKESLPLIPAILTFLLSCIAIGRGGILSSAILLLFVLFYNTFMAKTMRLRILVTIVIFIVVLGFIYVNYYDLFFKEAFERLFSEKLVQNERVSYFEEYLDYLRSDLGNLLFGVKASDVPSIRYLGGNFHNSYLSLHSKSGLLGFAIVSILIVKSGLTAIKNKKYIPLGLLVVVLVRILTDELCFTGLYDPLFYYLIFSCISIQAFLPIPTMDRLSCLNDGN